LAFHRNRQTHNIASPHITSLHILCGIILNRQAWSRKVTKAMDYDSFGQVDEAGQEYESIAKEMTKFADERKPDKQDRVGPPPSLIDGDAPGSVVADKANAFHAVCDRLCY